MLNNYYDIVVIGAGIHGAGVLQQDAEQGYSTLLLEQYDKPAQGTSSRSSKLIHGGLRYLETGELHLVYECLKERKYLLEHFPELVKLRQFYIPVYKNTQRPAWKIRLGLFLYALLSGFDKNNRFSSVKKSDWHHLNGLQQNDLSHVFRYHDAQTNDAVLTQAVLQLAQQSGAKIQYSATFQQANKKIEGYEVHYSKQQKLVKCSCRALINATGPWVNQTLQKITPAIQPLEINLIQGTHILLPGNLKENIYYLESPDDLRAVFAMPWQQKNGNGCILLGTTEVFFTGKPENVQTTEAELQYLLNVFNYYFPNNNTRQILEISDIIHSFAGLRVLPKTKQTSFSTSREVKLTCDDPNNPHLINIYGGKLTSFRATARKVMKQLQK